MALPPPTTARITGTAGNARPRGTRLRSPTISWGHWRGRIQWALVAHGGGISNNTTAYIEGGDCECGGETRTAENQTRMEGATECLGSLGRSVSTHKCEIPTAQNIRGSLVVFPRSNAARHGGLAGDDSGDFRTCGIGAFPIPKQTLPVQNRNVVSTMRSFSITR